MQCNLNLCMRRLYTLYIIHDCLTNVIEWHDPQGSARIVFGKDCPIGTVFLDTLPKAKIKNT